MDKRQAAPQTPNPIKGSETAVNAFHLLYTLVTILLAVAGYQLGRRTDVRRYLRRRSAARRQAPDATQALLDETAAIVSNLELRAIADRTQAILHHVD